MADTDSPAVDLDVDPSDVLTVAELNDRIGTVLDAEVNIHDRFVVGDVANCGESAGNVHFDLTFESASIHCILMEYQRGAVSAAPEDDAQVAVTGSLSYWEKQGSCTVFVDEVIHLGEGTYSAIYRENRETLAADGLLEDERKQALPTLPGTVGVVTSPNGSAREDVVTAIHDRYPAVDVVLAGATVQGEDALRDLMDAVHGLDQDPDVDVIVLTRGGGADQTLRVFNETPLCRVVANAETPVVAGIGHEDDRTLAEDVADRRVMTPTHAGEVVVPERAELSDRAESLATDLDAAYEACSRERLADYGAAINDAYEGTIDDRLSSYETALATAAEHQLATGVADLESRLQAAARGTIDAQVTELASRLDRAYELTEQASEHQAELESTEAARAATERKYRLLQVALVVALVILGVLLLYLLL